MRCGADLGDHQPTQIVQELTDTGSIAVAKCGTCGELLDAGSMYCKTCGSPAYVEEDQPVGSALQCDACKSYSPIGSSSCRMCGAVFVKGSRTVVDFAGATTIQQKAPTLPDLDEQMSDRDASQNVESGANTWALTVSDEKDEVPVPPTKGSAETSMLPGTAGAKSEQQSPTAIIDMGRITGPVDEQIDEVQPSSPASGELRPSGTGNQAPRTGANGPSQPLEPKKPTTSGFGSESGTSSQGSESKTQVFVSPVISSPPVQTSPPVSRPISQEELGTRQFEPTQPPADARGTREISPPISPAKPSGLETREQPALVPPPVVQEQPSSKASKAKASKTKAPKVSAADLAPPEAPVAQISSQAVPQKRTGMMIASVLVTLIVLGGAAYAGWWFLFARVRPAPPVVVVEPPTTPPPVTPTPPDKPPVAVVPEGMLAVAAGSYTIGRDNADPLEQPKHKVDLPAFFIDRTEVTNASYKKFLDATAHKAPTNWTGKDFPQGKGNAPVTGITWQDAGDYAAWAGKRLPSEVEWEAAARGTDGRIYPWGNEYRAGFANIGSKPDDIKADQYPSGIKEVGHYPTGASPTGALDMIGNAWEWVSDEIAPYPGNSDAKLKLTPGINYRVIRGGAYDGNNSHDATYRGFLDASEAYPKVGFRCAKDAK